MGKLRENRFFGGVSRIWNNKFFGIIWIRLALLALVLNFVTEIFNRLSFAKAVVHIFTNPLVFLYNSLIIFFTLTFAAYFKKRFFAAAVISLLWFALGVTNCVISANRKTPFAAPDFFNIAEGIKVINQYLSPFVIALLIALIVGAVALIVLLAVKSPKTKEKINYLKCALVSALTFGFMMLYLNIANATGLLATTFGNIRQGYRDYGFNYCFCSSVFNMGITKPKDYSKDKVDNLVDSIEETKPVPAPTDPPTGTEGGGEPERTYPNIIFVQLESLFDPTLLDALEFSEDPIPNLRRMYGSYSSGYLSVPSFGAGTANTEFEVITGMNLDDFGPGEYPYKTVLRENACESIGYYLKEYGYSVNALHNNDGDFYERNTVFSRLGFDTFTSVEYIEEYDVTPLGWAKDECLIDEIVAILDSTMEQQDFIYAISVQGHGDYPEDTEEYFLPIKVENNEITGNPEGFEYYVNEIHEMDRFVRDLTDTLAERDEECVVVFYGDHLPTFDMTDEDMKNGDIYQTQYVVWDNMGLRKEDKDIEAFQLSTVVLDKLGLNGGIISRYHAAFMDSEDGEKYREDLKLLEYDILYGDCEVYKGELPYTITNLKMGYKDIRISSARNITGHTIINGRNFTPFSQVLVNNEEVDTIFSNSSELVIDEYQLEEGDEIVVVQKTKAQKYLSSTSIYVYREQEKPTR
ncbi:MAG: LTA synthase family protein [Butyrivibrio sp.]|nr:LTA synthase family protein [Butyrivibrio sp.]